MNKFTGFLVLLSVSPLVLAGTPTVGYPAPGLTTQAIPVLSPVGLAGLAVVVGIGAARVLRNRRNR